MPHSDEIKKLSLDPAVRRLAELLDDMEQRCCPPANLTKAGSKKGGSDQAASEADAKK